MMTPLPIRVLRQHAAAAFFFCALFSSGFAQEKYLPETDTFDDQYHTSWTVKEGVPPGLWQVKQTADGFIWLASETGLYRFDGINFSRYQMPSGQKLMKEGAISALTPTADGGLWIAYRFGGVSFLRNDAITNYPPTPRFPETVFILTQDLDGVLWGATMVGLVRFDGKEWSRLDESWGPVIKRVDHMRLDPDGGLWVDDGKAYYVLPRGGRVFQPTGLPNGKLVITSKDTGWMGRDDMGLFPVHRSKDGAWSLGPLLLKEKISSITSTSDGSLWFGAHDGIWRIRGIAMLTPDSIPPGAIQVLRRADGLSNDFVYALTVDREGSLWALTSKGLDQFRKTSFTHTAIPPAMHLLQMIQEGQSILIGSSFPADPMLARVSVSGVESIPTPFTRIHAMYRDAAGIEWINADGKLWQLTGRRVTQIPSPGDLARPDLKIRAITTDRSGTTWISVLSDGPDQIYRFAQGRWTRFDGLADASRLAVTSMTSDRDGRVWMGTGSSRIYVVDGKKISTYGRKDGVDSGAITLLQEHGDHLWIGGSEHLDRFSNGRFQHVLYEDGSPISGVTGVVETEQGDVWLNCAGGIVKVEAAAMQDALQSNSSKVHASIFNYLDGYLDAPTVRLQAATLAQTTDGRLYFLGREGLVWADPAQFAKNAIAPGVVVTSVTVDHHTDESPTSLHLPEGAENVQINYTATSLLMPARVQFRYRLEGFDQDWQDVGTRRQAFYTHLPPGDYTFRVMASNNDGVWSESAATVRFVLPPTFLQSVWFKVLCVIVFALLMTSLYLFRVRLLIARVQHRLVERLAERERIARDLHDTFFQGIQGLFLRFNTGAAMLPATEPARQIFLDALEQSDRIMAEGRELVLDLRADDTVSADLAEELARAGEHVASPGKPLYKVLAIGQIRKLHPVCESELRRIGQEAVYNAFRHARASAIEVEVLYEKDFLKLRIRDDGQGIEEHLIRDGRRPGHMGLIGMSERAQRIGARYSIWSKKGQGTEIEVEVPAGIAYGAVRAEKPAQAVTRNPTHAWRI